METQERYNTYDLHNKYKAPEVKEIAERMGLKEYTNKRSAIAFILENQVPPPEEVDTEPTPFNPEPVNAGPKPGYTTLSPLYPERVKEKESDPEPPQSSPAPGYTTLLPPDDIKHDEPVLTQEHDRTDESIEAVEDGPEPPVCGGCCHYERCDPSKLPDHYNMSNQVNGLCRAHPPVLVFGNRGPKTMHVRVNSSGKACGEWLEI